MEKTIRLFVTFLLASDDTLVIGILGWFSNKTIVQHKNSCRVMYEISSVYKKETKQIQAIHETYHKLCSLYDDQVFRTKVFL